MNSLLVEAVSTRRFSSRTAKNVALALAILADDRYTASVTRTEVARLVGVTRETATQGIEDLLEQGLIEEIGSEPETTRQVRRSLRFIAVELTKLPDAFPSKTTKPYQGRNL